MKRRQNSMRLSSFAFVAVLVVVVGPLSAVAQTEPKVDEHSQLIESLIKAVRPVRFNLKDGNRSDHKQVDATLAGFRASLHKALTDYRIAVQRAEQGEKLEVEPGSEELLKVIVRFRELFPDADDNMLFPLTESVVVNAPESSFAGLSVYGRHGEPKGRIVRKVKVWNTIRAKYISPPVDGTHYWTVLATDDKDLDGIDHRSDANNVKWGEIKNRIAFDGTERKRDEDKRLEEEALAASVSRR